MRTIKKTTGMLALRRKPPGFFGLCRILVFQRVSGVYDSYPHVQLTAEVRWSGDRRSSLFVTDHWRYCRSIDRRWNIGSGR